MMKPTAVWSESLNEQLCTASVTSTQATGVSTSAFNTSRSPVLAARVYRRNPASGAVDKKTQRRGLRNTELKKMTELQGTATVTSKPTHKYELRKTSKRIEAELKVLHSHTSVKCMFLENKQKLPNNKKLTVAQSQTGHNPELCISNQANCLHSQTRDAVCASTSAPKISRSLVSNASTSVPKTSRSQVAGAATSAPKTCRSPLLASRVYRRNPASGAVNKKTRRPDGGLSKLVLKRMAELQGMISVTIPADNRNALFKRMIEHCKVSPAAEVTRPWTMHPYLVWGLMISEHGQWEKHRLDRARRNGCVRKSLPHRFCG